MYLTHPAINTSRIQRILDHDTVHLDIIWFTYLKDFYEYFVENTEDGQE